MWLDKYLFQGKYILIYNIFERVTFLAFYLSIARYVEKETYGLIVTVFSFTNILLAFFDFGFPSYLQREAATKVADAKETIYRMLQTKVIIFLVVLIISSIYFMHFTNDLVSVFLISFVNILYTIVILFTFYLNGLNRFKESTISVFLTRIPLFIVLVIFTLIKMNYKVSLFFLLLTFIIQLIIVVRFSSFQFSLKNFFNFQPKEIISLIKYTIPFGIGSIFVMAYDRIDVLFLQLLRSNTEVAIYSVAYSIYRNSSIISGIILMQVYNNYSIKFIKDRCFAKISILKDGSLLFILSVILIFIYFIFGYAIITLLFGKNFHDSSKVLYYLSFALPFLFLNNFTGVLLNSSRNEKLTMTTTFIGFIINVTINLILIPKLGIMGAVLSTILTEFFVFIIQAFMLTRLAYYRML